MVTACGKGGVPKRSWLGWRGVNKLIYPVSWCVEYAGASASELASGSMYVYAE